MRASNRRSGFTLIEIVIVVAVILIVAAMAIPRMQAARLSANESSAAATLRAVAQAQAQVVTSASVDTDVDGMGEYAYFAELAGSVPLRISVGGAPGAGLPGDELDPSTLQAAFGNVNNGLVTHAGYFFRVWLPDATAGGLVAGIPEDAAGGKTAAPFPDADNSEVYWCAYGWPMQRGQTGTLCVFMSSQGQLLAYSNRGAVQYSGAAGGPAFDAAFTVAGDMGSAISAGIGPGVDGNLWNPLR